MYPVKHLYRNPEDDDRGEAEAQAHSPGGVMQQFSKHED